VTALGAFLARTAHHATQLAVDEGAEDEAVVVRCYTLASGFDRGGAVLLGGGTEGGGVALERFEAEIPIDFGVGFRQKAELEILQLWASTRAAALLRKATPPPRLGV